MTIVKAENLVKTYPKPGSKTEVFNAVDGLSLEIKTGEVYGLLGPNGAGKTTTLEMLEGLSDIDSGEVIIDGISVKENPYKVKEIIGIPKEVRSFGTINH